ncbi:hypothetical protein [Streptomyces sp. 8N706]
MRYLNELPLGDEAFRTEPAGDEDSTVPLTLIGRRTSRSGPSPPAH